MKILLCTGLGKCRA